MEGSAPLGGGDEPIKSDGLIASQEEVAKAIEQALSRPCKVDRVLIAGLERTKQDVVRRELADLAAARTLDEIHALLVEAHSRLEDLDVFKAVEITIDESPKVSIRCFGLARMHTSQCRPSPCSAMLTPKVSVCSSLRSA